ncbi:MAG: hypothetical protein CMJ26_07630 [Phycisphaerae bacterium]|nr:hypothetical protein [Phycisphaerae bacterium]|tara:strand:+ start:2706 stop:2942 length:237 start_codon:yes stop_codon:yes gene_type:complete
MYEGPSEEDIERFSSDDTGYCPHCGEEIWDDVTQCPACGSWIQGSASHRTLLENDLRKRMIILIIALALGAFVILQVF